MAIIVGPSYIPIFPLFQGGWPSRVKGSGFGLRVD